MGGCGTGIEVWYGIIELVDACVGGWVDAWMKSVWVVGRWVEVWVRLAGALMDGWVCGWVGGCVARWMGVGERWDGWACANK